MLKSNADSFIDCWCSSAKLHNQIDFDYISWFKIRPFSSFGMVARLSICNFSVKTISINNERTWGVSELPELKSFTDKPVTSLTEKPITVTHRRNASYIFRSDI